MPYATNSALPASVRLHLAEHAQDIYRAAFNHAFAAHAGDPRQEEAAHRIAWVAVKRGYVKIGDRWVGRDGLQRRDELCRLGAGNSQTLVKRVCA